MKTKNLRIISSSAILLLLWVVSGCGADNSNSIRIDSFGQIAELPIQNTQCQAGAPLGGIASLPVACFGTIPTGAVLGDGFTLEIADVRAIQDQLGVFLPIAPGLLVMTLTFNGIQQAIITGGASFTQVSNIVGGRTCFFFEAVTPQANFQGNFCGNVVAGF